MKRFSFLASSVLVTGLVAGCIDQTVDEQDSEDSADASSSTPSPDFFSICAHAVDGDPGNAWEYLDQGWISNSCLNHDIMGLNFASTVQTITSARFTQFEKTFGSLSELSAAINKCQSSSVSMQAEFGSSTTGSFGPPFLALVSPHATASATVDPLHNRYTLTECLAAANGICHPFHRDGGAVSRLHIVATAGDGSTSGTRIFSHADVNDPTYYGCP